MMCHSFLDSSYRRLDSIYRFIWLGFAMKYALDQPTCGFCVEGLRSRSSVLQTIWLPRCIYKKRPCLKQNVNALRSAVLSVLSFSNLRATFCTKSLLFRKIFSNPRKYSAPSNLTFGLCSLSPATNKWKDKPVGAVLQRCRSNSPLVLTGIVFFELTSCMAICLLPQESVRVPGWNLLLLVGNGFV